MSNDQSSGWNHPVSPQQVAKAVKLSCSQAMIFAFFAASGNLLSPYALAMGATPEQIGLLATVPMYGVLAQLVAAVMVERGVSRKRMTLVGHFFNIACWGLIIALPLIFRGASDSVKITGLIAVFTMVSAFGHLAGNARASWVGDLIPSDRLGTFFGRLMLYGGFVGAVLAITQGRFLDYMKGAGLSAFGWVFAFGMVFGVANAMLFIPQADIRTPRHNISLIGLVKQTLGNRSLLAFMAFAVLWNMQSIAFPFYSVYLLKSIKLSYTTFSIIGTIQGIVILLSSPFWGRVVSRHGCRPVLIICSAITVPVATSWIWIGTPLAAYIGVPIINIITGFANGGLAVAISTIIYKVTTPTGRSIQMAIYSVALTFLIAPMPVLGGHLPGWLNAHGIHADLRSTFYISQIFAMGALLMARKVTEPGSSRTGEVVDTLKSQVIARLPG